MFQMFGRPEKGAVRVVIPPGEETVTLPEPGGLQLGEAAQVPKPCMCSWSVYLFKARPAWQEWHILWSRFLLFIEHLPCAGAPLGARREIHQGNDPSTQHPSSLGLRASGLLAFSNLEFLE